MKGSVRQLTEEQFKKWRSVASHVGVIDACNMFHPGLYDPTDRPLWWNLFIGSTSFLSTFESLSMQPDWNINQKTLSGKPLFRVLRIRTEPNAIEFVQLLIRYGYDFKSNTYKGYSAVDNSYGIASKEIMKLMMDHGSVLHITVHKKDQDLCDYAKVVATRYARCQSVALLIAVRLRKRLGKDLTRLLAERVWKQRVMPCSPQKMVYDKVLIAICFFAMQLILLWRQ